MRLDLLMHPGGARLIAAQDVFHQRRDLLAQQNAEQRNQGDDRGDRRAEVGQPVLERAGFASISELAQREGEDRGHVGRMLDLTLLAPDIVAAVLDESLPELVRLQDLVINPPILWDEQRAWLTSSPESGRGRRSPRGRS